MESPVVLDKPPEYHGNERGFPFDEEDGSAWSELASRHPDIAARLRQRPATWARKRRPSSQDATDDFGDGFGGFDRFPFDDIPPEFREHFPSHWNRQFGSREEQPTSPTHHQPQSPQQQTAATQTESKPGPSDHEQQQLPQYGLRNTVDLGQKSPADPSLVDGEDRTHRSMSAPPDNRSANQQSNRMSGQHPQDHSPQQEQSSNVRHIPIFVEGRDEPVINKTADHGTHFGETKPAYVPPPQPHIDRDQYFADDTPHGFHHPPNFSRSFGTPFNKGFRQGPQPFSQQKMYPQNAFARGASPQRSQSPKPQMHPEEHFVKVPVYHEQTAPPPSKPQPKQPSPQRASQPPPQQAPQAPPQPKPQPAANDPITQILIIQSDVLNLMTEVENFTGNKKDKKYVYLDEMLTRNLLKLDNIETEGKENIRQARKEAIKCIEKCINVLEAKAEKGNATPQPQDVEMKNIDENAAEQETVQNGDVEMKEPPKELKSEPQAEQEIQQPQLQEKEIIKSEPEKTTETEPIAAEQAPVKSVSSQKIESNSPKVVPDNQPETEKAPLEPVKPETQNPQVTDTRPTDTKTPEPETKLETNEKKSPKKVTKLVKKRDKSKDKTAKDVEDTANKEAVKDNNETETVDKGSNKQESIDKIESVITKGNGDCMEVDGAASQ